MGVYNTPFISGRIFPPVRQSYFANLLAEFYNHRPLRSLWSYLMIEGSSERFLNELDQYLFRHEQAASQEPIFGFVDTNPFVFSEEHIENFQVGTYADWGLDEFAELGELDFPEFFAENMPNSPIHVETSNDIKRPEQDESKASHSQTQSNNSKKDTIFTPAFKATAQRQDQVSFEALPQRKSKMLAIDKIKNCSGKGLKK